VYISHNWNSCTERKETWRTG